MTEPKNTGADNVSGPGAGYTMDIARIQRLLPHRYPFLLIDRILELEPAKRIVAVKNVTINEQFFAGHFPDFPIMPGVLIVEAMAQAGGTLLMAALEEPDSKLIFFTGIERARFRRPVVPGDQLRIEVDVLAWRRGGGRMSGKAFVDGKRVCESVISCQLVDRERGSSSPGHRAVPAVDTAQAGNSSQRSD